MKNILAGFILLFFSAPVWAELEIIALKHRSAEEVLPVIRPLLDKNAVASGMNYQLILRTSPRNLEEIKRLLESIDVAPRRLKITVLQNVEIGLEAQGVAPAERNRRALAAIDLIGLDGYESAYPKELSGGMR
ncbi:MAG: hypothetical protein Q8J90_06040, partial [Gallionella sp.]|nr:hypothetical protein [Gallionella sp.]